MGPDPGDLRSPSLLGAGLTANLLIPIAFILGVTRLMAGWHNADEVQNILVGLALVASMPIAGSSTAWAQNADGELTLSLGHGPVLDPAQPADDADRPPFGRPDGDRRLRRRPA